MKGLEARILLIVQNKPGLQKAAVCREINGRWKYYCGRRNCYGNPRKRRTFNLFPCGCDYVKSTVFSTIDRMVKKGLLIQRREKKADGHTPRGWDYMKGVYGTLHVALGRVDLAKGDIRALPVHTTLKIWGC